MGEDNNTEFDLFDQSKIKRVLERSIGTGTAVLWKAVLRACFAFFCDITLDWLWDAKLGDGRCT